MNWQLFAIVVKNVLKSKSYIWEGRGIWSESTKRSVIHLIIEFMNFFISGLTIVLLIADVLWSVLCYFDNLKFVCKSLIGIFAR